MKFLPEASLDHEEKIYNDFNQEFSIDVEQTMIYTEETDNEFIKSDNEMKIFEKEFERIIPSLADYAIKLTYCVIINNDNDQYIIQRYNNTGVHSVGQLFGMWEIDSKAVQEVGNKISKLDMTKILYTNLKQGQHDTDITFALKLFGKWIEQTITSDNEIVKVSLLKELVNVLAFAIKKIDVNEEAQATQLKITICKNFGRILAYSVLQARSELKQKLPLLEEPESLDEYYNAMSSLLINLF
ncbi:11773_t:CDS:2, partial [Ambispora gerdemannii]